MFFSLDNHSDASLDGAAQTPEDICARAASHHQRYVGLTDLGSAANWPAFLAACARYELTPILGMQTPIAPSESSNELTTITMFASSAAGVRSIVSLTRAAQLSKHRNVSHITLADLAEHSEGLVVCTGCMGGFIAHPLEQPTPNLAEAAARLSMLDEILPGRLFIEIHRPLPKQYRQVTDALASLAAQASVPLVAAVNSRYGSPTDAVAYQYAIALRANRHIDDTKRPSLGSSACHMLSSDEAEALFSTDSFGIRALSNLSLFAEMVTPVDSFGLKDLLSVVPTKESLAEEIKELTEMALAGLCSKGPRVCTPQYLERLSTEIAAIAETGFTRPFFSAMEVCNTARENGVALGPGRGSVCSSLLAYGLSITEIDPLAHGLEFSRFINRFRSTPPDIDLDVSARDRSRLIDLLAEKNQLTQIGVLSRYSAKKAALDVGRISHTNPDVVRKLVELIDTSSSTSQDAELNSDLARRALKKAYRLCLARVPDEDARQLSRLCYVADLLIGHIATFSTHPSGLLFGTHHLPTRPGSSDIPVTQFGASVVESFGYDKIDVLGLKVLDVIKDTRASFAARSQEELPSLGEIISEPSPQVFSQLSWSTTGLFQLEAPACEQFIQAVAPKTISELTTAIALWRPGPMQARYHLSYVAGRSVKLPQGLSSIVNDTRGIPVFQEQLAALGASYASLSPADSDQLRHAVAKGGRASLEKLKERFLEGSARNHRDEKEAEAFFSELCGFAAYGFNKAHAVAYALVVYETAWLRTNAKADYFASLLSCQDPPKYRHYIDEASRFGLVVLPANLNASHSVSRAIGSDEILLGLTTVNGCGACLANAIVSERESHGAFLSALDAKRRLSGFRVPPELYLQTFCATPTAFRSAPTAMPAPPSLLRTSKEISIF